VVTRSDPASIAECLDGGTVVSAGLDDNQDQLLEDTEVMTHTVLCNDPPVVQSPPIVVRLVDEPGGKNCDEDGTAVQSGPDRNGNGKLEDAEVVHTDYVCGQALVTRFDIEPAGDHCVAGGIAFFMGIDRDGDHELADTEIEQTEYECSEILSRNVDLKTDADIAALAGIRVIDGSVRIIDANLVDSVLPRLAHVHDLVIRSNNRLGRISLPSLREVEDFLIVADNPVLTAIDAPLLQDVRGPLELSNNPVLADLSGLPDLSLIGGAVQIDHNAKLGSLGTLRSSRGSRVSITDNPALASVSWFTTTQLTGLQIRNNGITSLNLFSSLFSGSVLGDIAVVGNPMLQIATLDADQLSSLQVTGNPQLTSLMVRSREITHDATVVGNGHMRDLNFRNASGDRRFRIGGALSISEPLETLSRFEGPITIDGDCRLAHTQLSVIGGETPIEHVGGTLSASQNPALVRIGFVQVERGVELIDNPVLTTTTFERRDLSRPIEYTGDVIVTDNPMLRRAQLLSLVERVQGDVVIERNATLETTLGDTLTSVEGNLIIEANPRLADLGFPGLRTVDGAAIISEHPSLITLGLPSLQSVGTGLEILQNSGTHHLEFPVLGTATMLVEGNPVLPSCEVEALFERVFGNDIQRDNDDTASCSSAP
jgi:hypothetical protein